MVTITGLPPNTSTQAKELLSTLQSHYSHVVDYFEVPSYDSISAASKAAFSDSAQAWRSLYRFLTLTSKPLLILLALIGRCLYSFLKVVSEHSLKHGYVAAKKGYKQLSFAAIWLARYQASLSSLAVAVELGAVLLMVGVYMLRRFIEKRRYVQRLRDWHLRRRKALLIKYDNFIDKVSHTSLILALLFPHILFLAFVLLFSYSLPSVVRYLACKTYGIVMLSVWYPSWKTVWLIHEWTCFISAEEELDYDPSQKSEQDKGQEKTMRKGLFGFGGRWKKKPKTATSNAIAVKAAPAGRTRALQLKDATAPESTHNRASPPSYTRQDTIYDGEALAEEAIEFVKYWIVYGILCALYRTVYLLPIIGRVFSVTPDSLANNTKASVWRKWGNRYTTSRYVVPKWFDSWKFSYERLQEIKLIFFVWLCLLPTSLTRSSAKAKEKHQNPLADNDKTKSKLVEETELEQKEMRTKQKKTAMPFANRPVDIFFQRMAPSAIAMIHTSNRFTSSMNNLNPDGFGQQQIEADTSTASSMLQKTITKFASLLDLMVWIKLISKSTKHRIVNTLCECTALLPASITLLMPSYFTQFGCIYIAQVVPAAQSACAHNDLLSMAMTENQEAYLSSVEKQKVEKVVRYLQYWILHNILTFLLTWLSPLLAWVPLSTHATWILWAYVQLEIRAWYKVLEMELVAFGFLRPPRGLQPLDLDHTLSFRLWNRVSRLFSPADSLNSTTTDNSNRNNRRTSASISAMTTINRRNANDDSADHTSPLQGEVGDTSEGAKYSLSRELQSVSLAKGYLVQSTRNMNDSTCSSADATIQAVGEEDARPEGLLSGAVEASTEDSA